MRVVSSCGAPSAISRVVSAKYLSSWVYKSVPLGTFLGSLGAVLTVLASLCVVKLL